MAQTRVVSRANHPYRHRTIELNNDTNASGNTLKDVINNINAGLTAAQAGLVFQGVWDAGQNNPPIPVAGNGNNTYYYLVTVAGTTEIDGVAEWNIGDWLVSDGTAWYKLAFSQRVNSVAGKTGTVSLVTTDMTTSRTPTYYSSAGTSLEQHLTGIDAALVGALHSNQGYYHVNGRRTDTYTPNGSYQTPYKTIQAALTAIGTPTSADEQNTRIVLLIAPGEYDESITIPAGRSITLIALGPVTLGDSVDSSTTARNITWSVDEDSEHTGGINPSLTIATLARGNVSHQDSRRAVGFIVTGDFIIDESSPSSIELFLNSVVIKGDVNGSGNTGPLHVQMYDTDIIGDFTCPPARLDLVENCKFGGPVAVIGYSRISYSVISAGIFVATLEDRVKPRGLISCDISGTFTGSAGTFLVDRVTDYYATQNGVTLGGTATKVLLDTSSEDKNYEQAFTSVSTSLAVAHNLGKYPSIQVIDGDGEERVVAVTHTDRNNAVLSWEGSLTGTVICN